MRLNIVCSSTVSRNITLAFVCLLMLRPPGVNADDRSWRPVPLEATTSVTDVQPFTGIAFWDDKGEQAETDAIQLEFSYLRYSDVVVDKDRYDWKLVDDKLEAIATRGHQAVLRFWFVYPGHPTSVPLYIKRLDDYHESSGEPQGEETGFPDWSHVELQRFTVAFYSAFAERYDNDRRLAYLQTGFGLWAEYHIYDGPMRLGETFPSKEFQSTFLRHMDRTFRQTPWLVSVDAAERERAPIVGNRELLALDFGTFDDSFLHREFDSENAPNHVALGRDRYLRAPVGGEFNYYTDRDQRRALAPTGPHGVPFETSARDWHLTFIIGNDQPEYRSMERIRRAGAACGYRFRVDECETDGVQCRTRLTNIGIAPIYFDAWPTVAGTRAEKSLKGLAPGASQTVTIPCTDRQPAVTIECDRLMPGHSIGFELPRAEDDGK